MSGLAPTRGRARQALQFHAGLVFVFFYAPILLLVIFSFSDSQIAGEWGGFTLDWYREFTNDRATQDALQASLKVAAVATIASILLGTMSALALERFRFRGRRVFDTLLYLPLIIPDVTMAIMLLLFFSEATELLGVSRGFATITLAHIAFSISTVSVVVRARLAGSSDELEEAARDLYASRWQAFRYVTLPIMMPGIIGGGLLAFTISLDDVVVTQLVTGPGWTTLPVHVFGLIRRGVTPLINAVSVVMLVGSMLLVALSLLASRLAGQDNKFM
ncbi:MAG: ABC transporter permease [Ilumatobacteraceae bacterium]